MLHLVVRKPEPNGDAADDLDHSNITVRVLESEKCPVLGGQ
jgi:hypothetical protein